eukprot:sb/3477709/
MGNNRPLFYRQINRRLDISRERTLEFLFCSYNKRDLHRNHYYYDRSTVVPLLLHCDPPDQPQYYMQLLLEGGEMTQLPLDTTNWCYTSRCLLEIPSSYLLYLPGDR